MIELSGLVVDKDIKIEYTGLRPGEKLYEEVLSNVENEDYFLQFIDRASLDAMRPDILDVVDDEQ